MKFLRFNFCHPVKGYASLTQLKSLSPQFFSVVMDSKDTDVIEIAISACVTGQWKAVLNWDYDGNSFSHTKEFEVANGMKVID